MDLKGSKTEKNLMEAFSGEAEARCKYNLFSEIAKKEGYQEIATIFDEISNNELAHAKIHLEYLKGLGDTKTNLADAAAAENYEWTDLYRNFALIADEEGFKDIAIKLRLIGEVEKNHEQIFRRLLEDLENGTAFKKYDIVVWKCKNCGHIHIAKEAPAVCPVCNHPQSYFKVEHA